MSDSASDSSWGKVFQRSTGWGLRAAKPAKQGDDALPASDAPPASAAAAVSKAVAPSPPATTDPPAGSTVSASGPANAIGLIIALIAMVVAFVVPAKAAQFTPASGFVLLAGFYVAAQAVERILEFALWPGENTAQGKADRTIVVAGLATLLGVLLSLWVGLYFLTAVSVHGVPRHLDVAVTGLVIGGGTKPLHDLVGLITPGK